MTEDVKRAKSGQPHGEEKQLPLEIKALEAKYHSHLCTLRRHLKIIRSESSFKSDRIRTLEAKLASYRDTNENLRITNAALKDRIEELERNHQHCKWYNSSVSFEQSQERES